MRQWIRPKLVIIDRGSPGEYVLQSDCKVIGLPGGQGTGKEGCDSGRVGNCGACRGRSGGS